MFAGLCRALAMFNHLVKLWLLHRGRNGSLKGKFPAQEAPLETNLICREHVGK